MAAGAVTAAIGILYALNEWDIKWFLAFSAIENARGSWSPRSVPRWPAVSVRRASDERVRCRPGRLPHRRDLTRHPPAPPQRVGDESAAGQHQGAGPALPPALAGPVRS
jgi:hypothetical protein